MKLLLEEKIRAKEGAGKNQSGTIIPWRKTKGKMKGNPWKTPALPDGGAGAVP
ncbi:MAG: hypothetical protein VB099_05275 [Candidatus Limiplasma sp.]|nr:hypothetical protein [Candidatus Limiplasma sp.]